MASIMIIGGSGYLGSNLKLFINKYFKHDVFSTYYDNRQTFDHNVRLNVLDAANVRTIVATKAAWPNIMPDIVVHAAGITNMNYCALHRQIAWKVNVEGTRNVVDAVNKISARLIHISTDLVYSGARQYSNEADNPVPICYYGKTKLEAEHIVRSNCRNFCILRTSLLYGLSKTPKKQFYDIFISNLLNNKSTNLFVDEFRTPILLDNYCSILVDLAANNSIQGLYNICGGERMSRYELGEETASVLGLDKSLVIPTVISDNMFVDKRPKDCSMSSKTVSEQLSMKILGIQESLSIIKSQLITNYPSSQS